jgi:hypothetical protein
MRAAGLRLSFASAILFGALAAASPQVSFAASWVTVPGNGSDIAVSPSGAGTAWVLAGSPTGGCGGDYAIYHQVNGAWQQVNGCARRIAVDTAGNPWVTVQDGRIFHWNGSAFIQFYGSGSDIAVGANGTVWVLGGQTVGGCGGDFPIYQLINTTWIQRSGCAKRIAVAPDGSAWVATSAGNIFRWNGSYFVAESGQLASDLSIGQDGSVWIASKTADSSGLGYKIYYRSALSTMAWVAMSGAAINISAGFGQVWKTDANGTISNLFMPLDSTYCCRGYSTITKTGWGCQKLISLPGAKYVQETTCTIAGGTLTDCGDNNGTSLDGNQNLICN